MLRKVVKAVAGSAGRQRDIVLPSAVLNLSECTFAFDPDVVVAWDDELHNPQVLEYLEGIVPTRERFGNVPAKTRASGERRSISSTT